MKTITNTTPKKIIEFSDLLGEVITHIYDDRDIVRFTLKSGDIYELWHDQSCCEHVELIDVAGEWKDLLDEPLVQAEEVSNMDDPPRDSDDDSYTWTFYKMATKKGGITMRWYGGSNGFYSERVDFRKI